MPTFNRTGALIRALERHPRYEGKLVLSPEHAQQFEASVKARNLAADAPSEPNRDAPIYEYACHEGNYAMPGILAGARRAEADGVPYAPTYGAVP